MVANPEIQEKSTVITLDDLMEKLTIDKRAEVVNGEFVESDPMSAGFTHVTVIENVAGLIKPTVRSQKLGVFKTDGLTCVLHVSDDGIRKTRIPDACFIRRDRIPKKWNPDYPFPGAPDLAVEVISPNQNPEEMLERIDDYLQYGTEQIWVIYPRPKIVHIYTRTDRNLIHVYHENDTFAAETLFPGLTLNVADFFKSELEELDLE